MVEITFLAKAGSIEFSVLVASPSTHCLETTEGMAGLNALKGIRNLPERLHHSNSMKRVWPRAHPLCNSSTLNLEA